MRQKTPTTFAAFPIIGSELHMTSATALKGIVSFCTSGLCCMLYSIFTLYATTKQ